MSGPIGFVMKLQKLYPFRQTAEQIQDAQERRFRALLRHVVAHSPFYRKKYAGIDIERCAVADLPTLTKAEMMANFDDLVTDRRLRKNDVGAFVDDPRNLGRYYLGRYGVSHTSGSQGQPALIVQDRDALDLIFAVQFARGTRLKRKFLPHLGRVLNPARMAVLTIKPGFYPSAAAFAYLPAYLRPVFKILPITISDALATSNRKLETFRPHYITGYASALEAFGREQEAGRLRLRELGTLTQITNVAEPMPADKAAWLEQVFGAHVSDEYALGECLVLSSGCTAGRGAHVNADLAILEVVDEAGRAVPAGTEGSKVLVTNLYNHVQPFIRYEVDDRVTMGTAPCGCGSVLPHIANISGRSKDLLWIETGGEKREVPYYAFLLGLHHLRDMAEHQIVQTGPRHFLVRGVPQKGGRLDEDDIRRRVQDSLDSEGLQHEIEFDVEVLAELPRGPSGKIMRTKNEYAAMIDP